MITDEQVEAALDWMRDNADAAAEARAHRIYLTEYRKSLKAMIMTEYNSESIGAQEREAYSDKRYLDHLKGLKEAVARDEKMQWLMEVAKARLEAWRTMNANKRADRI